MKNGMVAALLAVILIGSVGTGYFAGVSNRTTTKPLSTSTITFELTTIATQTVTKTTTNFETIHTTTTSTPHCPTGVIQMTVNGSRYCSSDVSNDIVIQQPGYGYFLNSSITFMGVKFETICPSNYRGCPGSSSNSTIVYAGAIQLNVTFSDGTKGTLGGVIGDSTYFFAISRHLDPKVGILTEYFSNTSSYKTFLLASLNT